MLIDAFLYNGERDILDLRINELKDVVDKFVIVESLEHHGSYNRKLLPSVFVGDGAGNKIHYVCLDHLEPAFDGTNSWARENYHRNAIMWHVAEVAKSDMDVVMLSDCDEVPRAERVGPIYPGYTDKLYGTCQDFFYYNVNTYGGEWHGTVLGSWKWFLEGTFQDARNQRDSLPLIPDCGWHFSYFGGIDRIRNKTRNFAHAHEDICKILESRTDTEMLSDIKAGRDLYHRDMSFVWRDSDDYRLPKYFLENRERFPLWTT
jgi:beta-1,4-mannosyl-glycoprotein beta-1,4-N-acetylglucosaminyltransferase